MYCLIIDDEPAAREILKTYISELPFLACAGVCKNAIEASQVLNEKQVDLLFLDINMPKLSGMHFYKSLSRPPMVIFTTAYPEYAVEGFEVEAIDYLLKPFPFERFLKAVNKARSSFEEAPKTKEEAYILLKSDKKLHRVPLHKIYHLEAIGDYVKVRYEDQYLVVHDTFQHLLQQLPNTAFIRIHKSHAIALEKLVLIEGNRAKVKDQLIPIGPTYKSNFLELVKKMGVGD